MAARTEAETFGNAPGTVGIPKLKARRFGFDRESNQRALSPPSEWCEGQTLAWLKSCWQKELIRSRCETAVKNWAFCPSSWRCGDGSSRCKSSYCVSFPFLVPRPATLHLQQQGAAPAMPGHEEMKEVASCGKGPQRISFKSPDTQMN